MTVQEVKEEHRDAEGDPLLKSRVRSVQRDMMRKRMMAAVPEADVVVTNPTHLAVALKYDQTRMSAPIVVAKGAGHLAERIRAVARQHGVAVVENKFVARTLYKLVDIGKAIPADLYRAVAEILAFVFRARGLTSERVVRSVHE
jgi:flagellar biosynthetic protein FlhB